MAAYFSLQPPSKTTLFDCQIGKPKQVQMQMQMQMQMQVYMFFIFRFIIRAYLHISKDIYDHI